MPLVVAVVVWDGGGALLLEALFAAGVQGEELVSGVVAVVGRDLGKVYLEGRPLGWVNRFHALQQVLVALLQLLERGLEGGDLLLELDISIIQGKVTVDVEHWRTSLLRGG